MQVLIVLFFLAAVRTDEGALLRGVNESDDEPLGKPLHQSDAPAECSSYSLLSEDNRKQSFLNKAVAKCDNGLATKWYRFADAAGKSMPESCVDKYRCGTHAPGWLHGKHPTVAEGVVSREVCYHWSSNCCNWKNNIKVRNCGEFYVYQLVKPPACSLRYCGGPAAIIAPTPTVPAKSECSSYTPLNEANRKQSFLNKAVAKCDNGLATKWYRFADAAGKSMPESCVDKYRCGTHAPGWLNGKHPTVAEGVVSREVCYHWSSNCCNWKNNIKVSNCGEFYVYQLVKPPACSLRYCGGPAAIIAPTPTVPVADPCVAKPCKNGAACSARGDGFSCACLPGFTGKTCEEDVNECQLNNGRCSHKCTNTAGSFKCECPDPELSLAEDQRTCKASGIIISCRKTEMSITVPKALLHGMNREHLRLNDPSCHATETVTHYTLTTSLTGCGTKARVTKESIAYSNRLMEVPVVLEQLVTRIRDIEIPFSCFYSRVGVASVVQMRMSSRKLVVSESQRANFTIALEVFPDSSYSSKISEEDFPVSVAIRKRVYFQLSVETKDKSLSMLAEECFATPTQDPNNAIRYEIIKDGCRVDNTVKYEKAPSVQVQRFSVEAFKFIGDNPFVFFHCAERICNASDPNSRCAKGCQQGKRLRRDNADSRDLYSLAQGPFVRAQEAEQNQAKSGHLGVPNTMTNTTLLVAMLVGVLCIVGMSVAVLKKSRYIRVALEEKN